MTEIGTIIVTAGRKAREFAPQLILDVTAAGTSTGAEATR